MVPKLVEVTLVFGFEKITEAREAFLPMLVKVDPRMHPLHGEARYQKVLHRLMSVAARKGTSLAVEREPGGGLRSGLRWVQK
jgi:hypothetical protein